MKVLLKSTISAFALYCVSDTCLQSGQCGASVGFICEFPLREVFDKEANELNDRSVT